MSEKQSKTGVNVVGRVDEVLLYVNKNPNGNLSDMLEHFEISMENRGAVGKFVQGIVKMEERGLLHIHVNLELGEPEISVAESGQRRIQSFSGEAA